MPATEEAQDTLVACPSAFPLPGLMLPLVDAREQALSTGN